MARNFLTPINLNGLELQGAAIGNLSTTSINAITSGTGRIQYDSTLNVLKYRDNTGWQTISIGAGSFYLGSTSVSLGNASGSVTSITGLSITGNAGTATILATARAINGVNFDGSGPITVKASTTYTLGLTNSNLAFSSGTTWDGGTTGITLGLAATLTSITSINGITVSGSSGSFLTTASTTSALTSVGTLNGLTIAGSQTVSMGSNRVTNVADPTSAQDAATKNYVDNVAQGVNVHDAVAAAIDATIAGTYAAGSTTANPPGDGGTGVGATITYTATGATVVDTTVTLAAGDRVLVMNGVTASAGTSSIANGVYVVTTAGTTGVATVLTRASDADNSVFGDLAAGDLIYVLGGTNYGGDQFVQTAKGTATQGTGAATRYSVKIGTDGISYTQFSGSGAVPYATTTTAGIASFPSAQFSVTTGAVTVASLAGSVINSSVVGATYGGTGVNNGSSTITLGGSLSHLGAFARTIRATATTDVTLPTTGTLATLAGSEALTGKTYNGLTLTAATTGFTIAGGTTSKTLTVNNTLAFSGTDSTTMTFPSTSSTVMTLAQPGTLTGKPTFLTPSGTSGGSFNIPSGPAVTSGWSSGDVWNESGVLKLYNGTATKTVAYTDSAMTGTVNGTTIPSSATLLTTASTYVSSVNGSSGAVTNIARKATQVGTGTGSTISWTNTWSTNLVVAQVYDTSTATATLVECDITATTSAVVATFASATTTLSNYTLVITG